MSLHCSKVRCSTSWLELYNEWAPGFLTPAGVISGVRRANQRRHSRTPPFPGPSRAGCPSKSGAHFQAPLITSLLLMGRDSVFCLWLVNASAPRRRDSDPPTIHNFPSFSPQLSLGSAHTFWGLIKKLFKKTEPREHICSHRLLLVEHYSSHICQALMKRLSSLVISGIFFGQI